MVKLNRRQTRSLSRLFDKVAFDKIGLDNSEDGAVLVTIEKGGKTATIHLDSEGQARKT